MPLAEHLHIGASVLDMATAWLAQPEPTPTPTPAPGPTLNTEGITQFIVTKIVPILLAVLGVFFISRAGKGEMSKVLTSTSIAMIGLAFIIGGATLLIFGRGLVNLIFPASP